MLQNEQTGPPPVLPTVLLPTLNAADARVTPDELNAALKALEDPQNSTVAIGSVVDELHLSATPEQIWGQVQKQRTEAAAPKPQTVPAVQTQQIGRQVRLGWRGMRGWVWVIFWCTGGFGLLSLLPRHSASVIKQNIPAAGIVVTGDSTSGSYTVQGTGPQRDVFVSGDHNNITVHGSARNVTVNGDHNGVWVIGSVEKVTVGQDYNAVHWTKEPPGNSVQPTVDGDNDSVSLIDPQAANRK